MHFIQNSGREEVKFYDEFYMILNKVVKMYMICYRNPTPFLTKSYLRPW